MCLAQHLAVIYICAAAVAPSCHMVGSLDQSGPLPSLYRIEAHLKKPYSLSYAYTTSMPRGPQKTNSFLMSLLFAWNAFNGMVELPVSLFQRLNLTL